MTPFTIRCRFKSGKHATKHGVWYPPALASAMAKAAAQDGQVPGFDGRSQNNSKRRKAARKRAEATALQRGQPFEPPPQIAGTKRSVWADAGDDSDDSAADSVRSKLARGLARMGGPSSSNSPGYPYHGRN